MRQVYRLLVRTAAGQTRATYSGGSKRSRHAQHVLADVRQDQVRGYRRHLVEPRLAELPLDIEFSREAESTVRLQADVRRFPRCVGGKQLRQVRLGAAGLLRVEEVGRVIAHQVGCS